MELRKPLTRIDLAVLMEKLCRANYISNVNSSVSAKKLVESLRFSENYPYILDPKD
jgi:hypothetical protein